MPEPIDLAAARLRPLNDRPVNPDGEYVLYWSQMARRLHCNHAIDYATQLAKSWNKPLVVYEGLKLNYPWANARIHQFMLEGMRDNVTLAKKYGVTYWPYVETESRAGRGLVKALCERAAALVTDDYPQFITPAQNRAVARAVRISVVAVDNNSVVPLSLLGPPTAAAAHLRSKIHKLFINSWEARARDLPEVGELAPCRSVSPFTPWTPPDDVTEYVKTLPIDQSVRPVREFPGGTVAAERCLAEFLSDRLNRYSGDRNRPDDPAKVSASRLSPYLHYGHISIQEVVQKTFDTISWTPEMVNPKTRNKDDFFCRDNEVNSFLDEAITWRDVGYQWHHAKLRQLEAGAVPTTAKSWQDAGEAMPSFNYETFDFTPLSTEGTLQRVLPVWAMNTLQTHSHDEREFVYSVEEFEAARTHDELWNAAQLEIVHTGRIHNYMRMLWGKKVLEWSRTPEEGYRVLEYLNNKYALDGRDPNSYCGILWVFGLFDRPWPPERKVFGTVRYMTSASTAKKFKMQSYLAWVRRLGRGAPAAT